MISIISYLYESNFLTPADRPHSLKKFFKDLTNPHKPTRKNLKKMNKIPEVIVGADK